MKQMHKKEVYQFLEDAEVKFEITEHEAVFHVGEGKDLKILYPDAGTKNLFVRDDKKRNYYLITVLDEKRVDLKQFQKEQGTRHLSFASADDMKELLNLTPGSVSPFGLFNDEKRLVKFYLDSHFVNSESKMISAHPNDNTATVWLRTKDLIKLIEKHGSQVNIVNL